MRGAATAGTDLSTGLSLLAKTRFRVCWAMYFPPMSIPSTAGLQKMATPVHSCLVLCPATLCTGLQLVLIISEQIQCPFDVQLVEHVQWIPQGRLPYGDLVPENKNTGTRIGKTMYPLSLRSRTTTKKIQLFLLLWSPKNHQLITHSNNINHDPITKSGFTVQPQQKIGLFHNVYMFSDIVMLMKIPPKSINTDYISSF